MDKEKEIDLNLITCTREQCIKFAEEILNDEYEEKELKSYFEKYRDDYSEEEAINIMKNLVIIRCNIDFSKTEYITYSGRLLLNMAKCIKIEGTDNFKILYGLCMSQINKEQTAFSDDASDDIINEIQIRFSCLIESEKFDAYFLRYLIKKLNEETGRFNLYI